MFQRKTAIRCSPYCRQCREWRVMMQSFSLSLPPSILPCPIPFSVYLYLVVDQQSLHAGVRRVTSYVHRVLLVLSIVAWHHKLQTGGKQKEEKREATGGSVGGSFVPMHRCWRFFSSQWMEGAWLHTVSFYPVALAGLAKETKYVSVHKEDMNWIIIIAVALCATFGWRILA